MILYGTVCRDGKGGMPVKSRSGLHSKYSFLQREINEKRNWRETRSGVHSYYSRCDVIAGGHWDGRVQIPRLFFIFFKLFLMIFNGKVCWDGIDCENWRVKTVKPSFEPQPASLMLKMRFLRRSGRKNEKSCSYGHGVSWVLAKNVFWVCAFTHFSRLVLARKNR